MNRIDFGAGACDKTRKYMDSYISSELLVETNHEFLRHIENCPPCAAELEARTQLRTRLKTAVSSQGVPPNLQVRIREEIRSRESGHRRMSWFAASPPRWAAAAAALLVVTSGVWWSSTRETLPALSDRPAQSAYIGKVSARLAAVLKVGLGDHIHCSVFRKYPQNPPPVENMEAELGPSYKGLLPVVRKAAPSGYHVIMAHHCSFAGRKYVHLTLKNGNDLVSLVIARRNDGESMAGLSAASNPANLPIYQAGAGRYHVAGFEAGDFLAYVVSDLKAKSNLQIASTLAPQVREFLGKVQG